MEEIWKDVPGFAGKYMISNTGKVKNIQRGNYLEVKQNKSYRYVYLTIDSKFSKQLNVVDTMDQLFNDHVYKDECYVKDLEGEVWMSVPSFESSYAISNKGRVKGLRRRVPSKSGVFRLSMEKLRCGSEDQDGYLILCLYDDGRSITTPIHRLVAEVFIPNPDNLPQVNHIDGNKHNNCVENLEWCTNQENMDHSWRIGLRDNKRRYHVRCIDTGEEYHSIYAIIRNFRCTYKQFIDIVHEHKEFHGHYYEIL